MRAPGDVVFSEPVWWRLVSLGLVSGLYAQSFFLPVISAIPGWGMTGIPGWGAFVIVFRNLCGTEPELRVEEGLWWYVTLGFLPNPILWIGVIILVLGWWRWAAAAGALALALGLIWTADPVTGTLSIWDLNVGYYCWLASMAVLAGSGLTLHLLTRATQRGRTANPELADTAEGRP